MARIPKPGSRYTTMRSIADLKRDILRVLVAHHESGATAAYRDVDPKARHPDESPASLGRALERLRAQGLVEVAPGADGVVDIRITEGGLEALRAGIAG